MKTREEIKARFQFSDEDTDDVFDIQRRGFNHGQCGMYPDGDFSSDADWCYGVGLLINKYDDQEVFDIYYNAHSEGLVKYDEKQAAKKPESKADFDDDLDPTPIYPWGNSPPRGEYTGD